MHHLACLMAGTNLRLTLRKGLTGGKQARLLAGMHLPAANRHIDIQRVKLERITHPSDALGGKQGGAAAQKRRPAPRRCAWSNRAARRPPTARACRSGAAPTQVAFFGAAQGVDARVAPNIGAVATVAAELDIVAVGARAALEHEHQLVLRAVE